MNKQRIRSDKMAEKKKVDNKKFTWEKGDVSITRNGKPIPKKTKK